MTTPGTEGEVSPESLGKTASSAVGSPPGAKPAPPRTAGNTADQNRLNLAKESRSIYGANWNRYFKKEIPVDTLRIFFRRFDDASPR
jgi:hypothetical protein